VPAIFTNVTPVALVSPLTLVVFDLQGEAVGIGEILFSTGPMAVGAALLFGLGLGVYREEDMFTQKPVGRKFLDALAVRLSGIGKPNSGGRSPRERPCARADRVPHGLHDPLRVRRGLLAVALLFALPVTVSIPVLLVTIAFIEELAKSIHLYAGFERGAFPDRSGRRRGRDRLRGRLLPRGEGHRGRAGGRAHGAGRRPRRVRERGGDGGAPPIAIVGLFFAPLLLHGFATTVAAVGASRSRTYYVLTLALATLLHAAYNFGVVRLYA